MPSGIRSEELIAVGTIVTADITGTAAGKLGHADGYVLVPAYGTDKVVELLSAVLIMDFATAAYTAGGNTTINIGGGGAAVTGLVSTGNFIAAAADAIYHFVPLSTVGNAMTANRGLNLVSASAPTQPGTAAGEIHYKVTYRVHTTNL